MGHEFDTIILNNYNIYIMEKYAYCNLQLMLLNREIKSRSRSKTGSILCEIVQQLPMSTWMTGFTTVRGFYRIS